MASGGVVLVAERGKFEEGPFTAESFAVGQDNSLECWPESGHPVRLRVSMQVGDLLIANNGDMGPMTFRIVPASAYQPDGVGDLNFPGDPFGLTDVASDLMKFVRHTPLDIYLAGLEQRLSGSLVLDGAPWELAAPSVLDGALVLSEHFDRIRWAIHGLTVAYVIEHLLAPEERVLSCSLRRPRRHGPFDLATDRRVVRFRLPLPIGSRIDERGLVDDLLALAVDESGRQTELYVVGEWPGQFLAQCDVPLRFALGKNGPTPEVMEALWGDADLSVAAFRHGPGARVDIVDVGPFLTQLFNSSAPLSTTFGVTGTE
jgi:hypothetical protein